MAIIVHLVALHVSQAFFRNLAKRGGSTKRTEKDLKKTWRQEARVEVCAKGCARLQFNCAE